MPSIQEIECSGSGLAPTFDLLSMSLFTVRDDKTIAFVNFAKKECSAYVGFSACFVKETASHTTHVKSLILDLYPGQRRRYGCNLTAATKEGKTVTVQWFLDVLGKRKYMNSRKKKKTTTVFVLTEDKPLYSNPKILQAFVCVCFIETSVAIKLCLS